jgi:ribosomal protein L21E
VVIDMANMKAAPQKSNKAPAPAPVEETTHRRLTMHERLEKRTQNMGALSVNLEEAQYTVNVAGRVPVELVGHLLALNERYVVFRYKKERSSKTVISRFLTSDIVSIVGEVGEPSLMVVMKNDTFAGFTGTVAVQKNGFVKVTANNGDSMIFNPNLKLESFSLGINAELSREKEEEPAVKSTRSQSNVTSIKRGGTPAKAEPAKKVAGKRRAEVEAFNEDTGAFDEAAFS